MYKHLYLLNTDNTLSFIESFFIKTLFSTQKNKKVSYKILKRQTLNVNILLFSIVVLVNFEYILY